MSESRHILADTAEEICAAIADVSFVDGWRRVDEAGLATLLVPEGQGGFGGDWGDALAVLRIAGARAVPLPLGECMVARELAARVGLAPSTGCTSLAAAAEGRVVDGKFTGRMRGVPWGRDVASVLAIIDGRVSSVPTAGARVERGHNPAGEPRDTLAFESAAVASAPCNIDPRTLGAFVRVAQCDGAAAAALAMAIEHANTRVQFGKPLAKLQAVQQSLAIVAAETAAISAAAQGLADALERGDAQLETAAAKLRVNIAIPIVTTITHQVHGAIGFTQEYPLHRLTRRMMGWRSEYGNDRYWAERLGDFAVRAGGAGLWAEITRRTDPA